MNDSIAELVEKNQLNRIQQIRNVCNYSHKKPVTADNIQNVLKFSNVIVDDKHKILYCYVPKVGCTSWKVSITYFHRQFFGERTDLSNIMQNYSGTCY